MTRMAYPILGMWFVFWTTQAALAQTSTSQPVVQASHQAQPAAQEGQPAEEPSDILDLPLEELGRVEVAPSLDVEVSSVSRSESTVGKSPAAIFVITNEMIRRSGARTIPEVLRMAPGVNVARISANKWAISIRGFNNRFANKLLVQIDGRSVYTPLFAGVYWDVQDVVLEDVDRIEIIRGPGATVWGANAVNGIINIITKSSKDTQGVLVDVGAGDEWESYTTARYGGQISKDLTYRVYGKWFERDDALALPEFFPNQANDEWRMGRGGARFDWTPNCCDTFTLQGDYYDGFSGGNSLFFSAIPFLGPLGTVAPGDSSEVVRGGNILGRWTRELSETSQWSLQAYYDRTERHTVFDFANDRNTVDLDFFYRFRLGCRHDVTTGFGYRFSEDFIRNVPNLALFPNARAIDTFSYFLQDRYAITHDRLYFTLGSKFSHNDFTGFEMQPTARLLYTPDQRRAIWASVSRAVRTPSRAEDDLFAVIPSPLPGPPGAIGITTLGSRNFDSEELLAYEMGMRAQPMDELFWDVALFYNDYTTLSSLTPLGLTTVQFDNRDTHEQTWGFELASTVIPAEWWTVRGAYSLLRGSGALGGDILNSPRNQFYLQSSMDFGCSVFLDVIGRYVDVLRGTGGPAFGPTSIPSYFQMDARLAYRPYQNVEWYLVGRNLLDQNQPEFVADPIGLIGSQVPREFFGGVTLRY